VRGSVCVSVYVHVCMCVQKNFQISHLVASGRRAPACGHEMRVISILSLSHILYIKMCTYTHRVPDIYIYIVKMSFRKIGFRLVWGEKRKK